MTSRSTITPHASHMLAKVEGETCCKLCFAAPWMPIIEQDCQGTQGGSAMYDGAHGHLTAAELQSALAMKSTGMTWGDIGAVLDRSPRLLSKAASRVKSGNGRMAERLRARKDHAV